MSARIDLLTSFCASNLPTYKVVSVGNFFKVPVNNRSLSPAGCVEFQEGDVAKSFLKHYRDNNHKVPVPGGRGLKVKPATSEFNNRRSFFLRKAQGLVEADAKAQGASTEVDF